ncbi:unnamed protein product [Rotaria socialis]|uniref:Uncharacterized protein n=1 Tax=Rotaria socialis TaxID=392032 RepID=A0A817Z8W7_9BILA|nr:unnamed protein product [Rotaria socialis]
MANTALLASTRKQTFISLRGLSHEVCVAATQVEYWQQLTKNSNISITCNGNYVPGELESICADEDEPRLQLVIESHYENDRKQFDGICTRIHYDLISFENNDRPIYDPDRHQLIVYGSLFNSLPSDMFDTERYLLGQRNCNIKKIRNSLACSISIDSSMARRHCFIIYHEKQTIMDLAAIELQALVRQAQNHYIMCYATKIGRTLIGPIERMETMESNILSSNPEEFPSYTPFQPNVKRKRMEGEEHALAKNQPIIDSDQSDDETIDNDKREQRREQIELLLNGICERMLARTPKDHVAKAREDSSQIKSYFRNTIVSKTGNNDTEFSIELVEHEIDLRTRGINEHKCTLVFNKQLKVGSGIRDRLKRSAKVRAYEKLKTFTRDAPRENLVLKPTKDGLWKVVMKPLDN